MTRALVTLRKVSELLPIPGSDNIQLAHVEGMAWNFVVQKDSFAVGDVGLVFEIDSAIEACEQLSFMGKPKNMFCAALGKHIDVFVVKTKLIRGVVSQGLLVKPALMDIPDDACYSSQNLCDILHVYHVDDLASPAEDGEGIDSVPLPWWVPKTDQTRVDSDISVFSKYKNTEFSVETKADGASMSVFYVDRNICSDVFGVTSHNKWLRRRRLDWYTEFKLQHGRPCLRNIISFICAIFHGIICKKKKQPLRTSNKFIVQAEKLNLEHVFERAYRLTGRNLVYQGELVGPGIQKNRDAYTEMHWLLFDIYDVDNQRYMLPTERYKFYYEYLYPYVEHVQRTADSIKVFDIYESADELQMLASHKTVHGNAAEGVVIKSTTYPYVSFKCISRSYLLRD